MKCERDYNHARDISIEEGLDTFQKLSGPAKVTAWFQLNFGTRVADGNRVAREQASQVVPVNPAEQEHVHAVLAPLDVTDTAWLLQCADVVLCKRCVSQRLDRVHDLAR